jgi:hypothetical protein
LLHSGNAARIGQRGGLGRRRKLRHLQTMKQFAPPTTAAAVRDLLAECEAALLGGKLDSKVASTVFYGATPLLRSIETSSLETRVAALEQKYGVKQHGQQPR